MSDVPKDLRYTEDHEWVRHDEDAGVVTVGITDYAQGELGDIVFLELPDSGTEASQGDACGTIEAVKAVAELYAPVSGTVTDSNASLDDAPETVNSDPYGEGWMIKIELSDAGELDGLLNAEAYESHIG